MCNGGIQLITFSIEINAYLDESKPMQLTFCYMQKKTVVNVKMYCHNVKSFTLKCDQKLTLGQKFHYYARCVSACVGTSYNLNHVHFKQHETDLRPALK